MSSPHIELDKLPSVLQPPSGCIPLSILASLFLNSKKSSDFLRFMVKDLRYTESTYYHMILCRCIQALMQFCKLHHTLVQLIQTTDYTVHLKFQKTLLVNTELIEALFCGLHSNKALYARWNSYITLRYVLFFSEPSIITEELLSRFQSILAFVNTNLLQADDLTIKLMVTKLLFEVVSDRKFIK